MRQQADAPAEEADRRDRLSPPPLPVVAGCPRAQCRWVACWRRWTGGMPRLLSWTASYPRGTSLQVTRDCGGHWQHAAGEGASILGAVQLGGKEGCSNNIVVTTKLL